MAFELKDIATVVALVLSISSLAVASRTKKDTLQLSFEQKRQEFLLLVAQRKLELESILRKIDNLHRDCRSQLKIDKAGGEHSLSATVGLMASSLYRESIRSDVPAVVVSSRNGNFVTHKHLVELEASVGQAKRDLQEAKAAVRDAEEFMVVSRAKLSELMRPDA